MQEAVPPVEYQRRSRVRGDAIRRGVCGVGAIHGLACSIYLGQRTWQWFAGTEQSLAQSQSSLMAMSGLLLQLILALAMFVCCAARFLRRYRTGRAWISAASLGLAIVWMLFGLLDDLSGWFATGPSMQTVLSLIYDLLRELNQFAVPFIVAYTHHKPRRRSRIALLAYLAMIISCLSFIGPNADFLIRYPQQPWIWVNFGFREWMTSVLAFSIALLVILLFRRWWSFVATAPLLAWLVRDTIVNAPSRIQRWGTMPMEAYLIQLLREISFLTITASSVMLGVVLFTILGLSKPRIGMRDPVS